MSRMSRFAVAGLALLLLVALIGPYRLAPEAYTAYTSAIQAFGVVIALGLGVWTLKTDSRDRRVDRVLALHQELTTGEVGEARSRLAHHLGAGSEPRVIRRASRNQLKSDPALQNYKPLVEGQSPDHDLTLLLRFFERVHVAQLRGSLDDLMLTALIGRHVDWWDSAIDREERAARLPMAQLSDWTNSYAERHSTNRALENWGRTRSHDFPDSLTGAQSPTPTP